MKIYKTSIKAKIAMIIFSIIVIWSCFLIIFDPKASIMLKMIVPFGFLLGIGGPWAMFTTEILTDDEKLMMPNGINILPLFSGGRIETGTVTLFWNEIGGIDSNYFLFAETGEIVLKPKRGINKRSISITIGVGGMPLDLLRDILAHLPPDAKVSLYPYLKRKLEGKQTWFYVK